MKNDCFLLLFEIVCDDRLSVILYSNNDAKLYTNTWIMVQFAGSNYVKRTKNYYIDGK